ncbi:MAG: hypothetical protein WC586_01260 [Methanoregula sp.]
MNGIFISPAGTRARLLMTLFLASFMIPAAPAAGPLSSYPITPLAEVPDISMTGVSLANMTIPPEYQSTPVPVTIFKAEVTATSLPGPRYMAFGPSVIGLSIDPRWLIILIPAIAVAAFCGYWYFGKRKREN